MFGSSFLDEMDCGKLARYQDEIYLIVDSLYSIRNENEEERKEKPVRTLYLAVKVNSTMPAQPWVIIDPEFFTEEERLEYIETLE